MHSGTKTFNLIDRNSLYKKDNFLVSCAGPCTDVNVFLEVQSGDLQLFALESSQPLIENHKCEACKSFCASQSGRGVN